MTDDLMDEGATAKGGADDGEERRVTISPLPNGRATIWGHQENCAAWQTAENSLLSRQSDNGLACTADGRLKTKQTFNFFSVAVECRGGGVQYRIS